MADNTEPMVFTKGDLVRVADTPSEAVSLAFDGWQRAEVEAPASTTPTTPTPADVAKAAAQSTKKDNA